MLRKIYVMTAVLAFASGSALAAGEFVVGDASSAKGGAASVPIGFVGDGVITDAQADFSFNAEQFDVQLRALGGAICSNPKAGLIRVVSPDSGGAPLGAKVGVYCEATFVAKAGSKADGEFQLEPTNVVCVANGESASCGGAANVVKAGQ